MKRTYNVVALHNPFEGALSDGELDRMLRSAASAALDLLFTDLPLNGLAGGSIQFAVMDPTEANQFAALQRMMATGLIKCSPDASMDEVLLEFFTNKTLPEEVRCVTGCEAGIVVYAAGKFPERYLRMIARLIARRFAEEYQALAANREVPAYLHWEDRRMRDTGDVDQNGRRTQVIDLR